MVKVKNNWKLFLIGIIFIISCEFLSHVSKVIGDFFKKLLRNIIFKTLTISINSLNNCPNISCGSNMQNGVINRFVPVVFFTPVLALDADMIKRCPLRIETRFTKLVQFIYTADLHIQVHCKSSKLHILKNDGPTCSGERKQFLPFTSHVRLHTFRQKLVMSSFFQVCIVNCSKFIF
jgi:hypothetical protein